ncbi:hypothetical protein [Paenibacillus sp. LHD-38]|uniref:hypothetical protein n=1 Tax=Paenibacillus sp. LHD-38 TaxID=3072143 RepID=UPI00280F23C3|nr:hypothetical protein [Paenibacillus sp. LHD-38]MDQ8733330.1 hypothetical protein [Paenibacillus sp. LHD-38]
MLKNRTFLFGLGTGIIIGALLFQLMLSGEESRQRLYEKDISADERSYTQVEVDALLKAERDSMQLDQEINTGVEDSQSKPAATAVPVKEESSKSDKDEINPTISPEQKAPIKHVIRIEAGLGLSKTAELLASQNIIEDQAVFVNKMKKTKQLVRAGYFLFQENITDDAAIAIVTGEPLTKEQADALTSSKKNS